ncbi:uncharacterized protein EKO05_0003132 [Ascochyta rabiei]|uniref:Uncharacterized protein n=1 Tax=Didymella rabiei TaxID=5454 RepID=A0A163BM29_DIDRA|nr:uncharacterized protein EKO05_0003132 [Ascochyta rabiei]KZM21845.1 hypothetical protein ST47_g7018 [Ascochyta rabiei]UPX12589.1 hypothetical protein EKO05_0003132 [Ascochyta rabiei]
MATFAPPARRDRFLYSSVLYADAGHDNHHPRASLGELTALLRPEAVKGKGKAKKPKASEDAEVMKDRPWHFWTAQLLHYGLTATKDKNAAKVRLLSALNEGRLEVPGWIQKLEGEVKKEWEAGNRRLKRAAKEGGVPKLEKSGALAAEARNSAGKASSLVEKESSAAKSKKVPGKKTSGTTPVTSVTPTSLTTKRKRDAASPSGPSKKTKARSTTEKTISSPVSTSTSAKPAASQKPPQPEEEPWPAPRRKIVAHDAWKFFDEDHLAHTRPPNAPHPCPYRISCPDAESEWNQDSIDEFYLAFSATEEEWWSRFKWGAFGGILILQRQPKRINKAVGVPFKWRAHYAYGNEDGDGTGRIFFDSASTIRGEFHDFFREKPCQFRGCAIPFARPRPLGHQTPQGTPVLDQMRAEWSQMPTAMRDVPSKKPRAKSQKLKPSVPASSTATQDDIYLSGTYHITAPDVEEASSQDTPLRLALFTDEATGIWWASFHWSPLNGVMKIDPGPTYDTIADTHSLGWRIRNEETGGLSFGRDCTGDIRFDGQERTLMGALYGVPGVGLLEFEGRRIASPRRVGGLKQEWDWFVEEAYGR